MARFIGIITAGTLCLFVPFTIIAQVQQVPLKPWPAPLYWQPSAAEDLGHRALSGISAEPRLASSTADVTTQATSPAGALVFVAMTPCRIADTRFGFGFSGAFGPPSLVGGQTRTFPIQSSTTCSVAAIAQAYSLNVTVVPSGATFPGNVNPSGALGYLTFWPTGAAQPNASTLNSWLGTVAANAVIVPAGTNGSVDAFASNNTDLIIDINGYYASQSGITLAQGTAAAPSLSFAGDSGTGIYSSGTGTVNIASGGTNRFILDANGNVGIGTSSPAAKLDVNGTVNVAGSSSFPLGVLAVQNLNTSNFAIGLSASAPNSSTGVGVYGYTNFNGGDGVKGVTGASPLLNPLGDGVNGQSSFSTGAGVRGTNWASSFTPGVNSGIGVIGTGFYGVQGEGVSSQTGSATVGVKGSVDSLSGVAGLFQQKNSGGKILSAISGAGTEVFTVKGTGNVGIGTSSPNRELEINGGVRLNTTAAKPTCDATSRGTFWFTQNGLGIKDVAEVCAKDGSDGYAWRTVY